MGVTGAGEVAGCSGGFDWRFAEAEAEAKMAVRGDRRLVVVVVAAPGGEEG